jgi:hypothetical protein
MPIPLLRQYLYVGCKQFTQSFKIMSLQKPSFRKKDRILKYLSQYGLKGLSSETVSKELGIEHYVIYSLCMEMELRQHLRNIQTTTVGSTYSCHSSVTPQGKYFIDKGGYSYEWFLNFIVDFPKNFWWLIAIITYCIGKNTGK